MALTIHQFEVQIRMNNIPHQAKYEVLYGNKIFDLEDSIEIRNKHLLENSFARFSGGVTMDIPILDFLGKQTNSILIRGRRKFGSISMRNAIINPDLNFLEVSFPVVNRRFT